MLKSNSQNPQTPGERPSRQSELKPASPCALVSSAQLEPSLFSETQNPKPIKHTKPKTNKTQNPSQLYCILLTFHHHFALIPTTTESSPCPTIPTRSITRRINNTNTTHKMEYAYRGEQAASVSAESTTPTQPTKWNMLTGACRQHAESRARRATW
jgi:hypothetical protein